MWSSIAVGTAEKRGAPSRSILFLGTVQTTKWVWAYAVLHVALFKFYACLCLLTTQSALLRSLFFCVQLWHLSACLDN
jgi:hypothetical protein